MCYVRLDFNHDTQELIRSNTPPHPVPTPPPSFLPSLNLSLSCLTILQLFQESPLSAHGAYNSQHTANSQLTSNPRSTDQVRRLTTYPIMKTRPMRGKTASSRYPETVLTRIYLPTPQNATEQNPTTANNSKQQQTTVLQGKGYAKCIGECTTALPKITGWTPQLVTIAASTSLPS